MTTQERGTTIKGRQRIDYARAEQMLRAGATQQEVADEFGVGQPAVNRAIWRGRIKNITYDRATMDDTGVPWHPIRAEHRSRYLVRMLRAATRRQRGEKSSPVIDAQLDNFLKHMEELDAVVHYDPDTDEGFFRVPRRHGVDEGLVRNPFLDDEGRKIVKPKGVRRKSK